MQVERERYVRLQAAYDTPGRPGVRLAVPNLFEPWMITVAESFCALADAGGLATRISVTRSDPSAEYAAAALCENDTEAGLVLVDPLGPLGPVTDLCRVAVLGRAVAHENAAWFAADDAHGMRVLMRHLLGRGHEAISYVVSEKRPCPRQSTYLEEMYLAGLAQHAMLVQATQTMDLAELAVALLDHQPTPTAMVGSNDHTALRVIDALASAGYSVPGDVAVAGFGNAAEATEALTTVDGRVDRIVAEAVGWLLGGGPPTTRLFEPHLVLRRTT